MGSCLYLWCRVITYEEVEKTYKECLASLDEPDIYVLTGKESPEMLKWLLQFKKDE